MADIDLLSALELHLGHGFTIEADAGAGATASVYIARRGDTGERVVVKVMRIGTQSDAREDRFVREMRILRKLDHPRIIPMREFGEASGMLFFTMPFIEGETLRARLDREGKLPIRPALRIASDVVAALSHAHANGIVHRDLKPANILVSGDDAYVMDFGLAWAPDLTVSDETERESRFIVGTPEYVSPEQVTGRRGDDWRGDFFSLGCVLYEMLAGRTPWADESARGTLRRRVSEPAPDVRELRPEVPDDVASIVRRALALHPSDRFATAGMMQMALDAALERMDGA